MSELQSDLPNNGCHVKTVINTRTYTFNWTVENFSKFQLGTVKTSPAFYPMPDCAFYGILKITKDLKGYLEFYHASETNIAVKYNLSIENNAGRVVLQHLATYTYNSRASRTHCDVLPSCIDIIKKARDENVLILKCVMDFYEEDQIDVDVYCYKQKPASLLDSLLALSNELKIVHDKLPYADVSLKVRDSIVPVHKLILCARSSVFARMFETPMDEREENVVHITDLELPVLRDLVSYLYTGVLTKDDFESVYSLYYAADKYDVSSLRKMCVGVLLSKLDVENACRVLALADQHSDSYLKDSVADFIKFHFDEVLCTDAWDELIKDSPRVATEAISTWGKNRMDKVKTDETNVIQRG